MNLHRRFLLIDALGLLVICTTFALRGWFAAIVGVLLVYALGHQTGAES